MRQYFSMMRYIYLNEKSYKDHPAGQFLSGDDGKIAEKVSLQSRFGNFKKRLLH